MIAYRHRQIGPHALWTVFESSYLNNRRCRYRSLRLLQYISQAFLVAVRFNDGRHFIRGRLTDLKKRLEEECGCLATLDEKGDADGNKKWRYDSKKKARLWTMVRNAWSDLQALHQELGKECPDLLDSPIVKKPMRRKRAAGGRGGRTRPKRT